MLLSSFACAVECNDIDSPETHRIAKPAPSISIEVSSRERGIWPFSRAFSSL